MPPRVAAAGRSLFFARARVSAARPGNFFSGGLRGASTHYYRVQARRRPVGPGPGAGPTFRDTTHEARGAADEAVTPAAGGVGETAMTADDAGKAREGSRVRWLGRADALMPPELRERADAELEQLFDADEAQEITVHNLYAGYRKELRKKLVLGVEVRSAGRYDTHIVKLGTAGSVQNDFNGWRGCAGRRYIGSRIFVRVRHRTLDGGRVGVVYEDAYTLFGLDPQTQQPEYLEKVVLWAVLDDKPDPVSVERVLTQIYGDLDRWFFGASRVNAKAARSFYSDRLEKALPRWTNTGAAAGLHAELRQEATWLLGGLDTPDALATPGYLDPCDYVVWALAHEKVPATLVGCSHGDLHGRNVLVGVRRGEAEFPVVFDYGSMRPKNVLAWDFVKLETELKARLLPRVLDDAQAASALRARRGDRPPRDTPPAGPCPPSVAETERAARARRLALLFEFETLLAELTRQIAGRSAAESRQPPGGRPVFAADRKVDRALSILLRVRQEAALALGYEKPGRHSAWRDEYFFALAVYGVSVAKWDVYEPQGLEVALVSAGVAVAHADQARAELAALLHDGADPPRRGPSYRPALRRAHRLLEVGDHAAADRVVREALADFPMAVPLRTEDAMIRADRGDLPGSLRAVEPLRRLCWLFGDYETLARIGRTYKDYGDREWGSPGPPYRPPAEGAPCWQYYKEAFGIYREAYEVSGGHYFPGVNLVTLALLTGDRAAAREYAEKVRLTCRAERLDARALELYWIFASEGEAALGTNLAGKGSLAAESYSSALNLVGPDDIRAVQSSWNQVCRLYRVLDRAVIQPVVDEFRRRAELWPKLAPGPLGDCDCDGRR